MERNLKDFPNQYAALEQIQTEEKNKKNKCRKRENQ